MSDLHADGTELSATEATRLSAWYGAAAPEPAARRAAIDRLLHPRVGPALALHTQSAPPRRLTRIALASGLAAAAALLLWVTRRDAGPLTSPHEGTQLVAFEVRLPAREVSVAGDFNGWNPDATPMQRQGSTNVWRASVPLTPGRHVYTFVVNGRDWVVDPLAPRADGDELGPANVIAVPGTGE